MITDSFDNALAVILEEISELQENIRKYDELISKNQEWLITIYSAMLIGSFAYNRTILLIPPIIIAFFWYRELWLKKIQRHYILRYSEIETCIRDNRNTIFNNRTFNVNVSKEKVRQFSYPDIMGKNTIPKEERDRRTNMLSSLLKLENSILYILLICLVIIIWILDVNKIIFLKIS
jgi:hypothetical protein